MAVKAAMAVACRGLRSPYWQPSLSWLMQDANANSCLHTLVGKPGGTRRRSLRGETWTLTSSVLDDRLSFHRGLSFFVLIVNAAAMPSFLNCVFIHLSEPLPGKKRTARATDSSHHSAIACQRPLNIYGDRMHEAYFRGD